MNCFVDIDLKSAELRLPHSVVAIPSLALASATNVFFAFSNAIPSNLIATLTEFTATFLGSFGTICTMNSAQNLLSLACPLSVVSPSCSGSTDFSNINPVNLLLGVIPLILLRSSMVISSLRNSFRCTANPPVSSTSKIIGSSHFIAVRVTELFPEFISAIILFSVKLSENILMRTRACSSSASVYI